MPSPDATVFVVDDDKDMRQSLKWLIESIGLTVQGFESAEQFLEENHASRPGCLLLDMRMPGMDGMRLLEQLRTRGEHLPVIVFTGHGDVPMAVQAMKLGAFDFVEKPATHQYILTRVRDALSMDEDLRASKSRHAEFERLVSQLSQREREVMEKVVVGETNKVIALSLGISERTVEKHRENIMQKMGVRSVAALVAKVLAYRNSHRNSMGKLQN
jgi:FixJ family two-component response regulator